MIKLNDGGPAFPSTISDDSLHVGGMTLRDYFAAKAMAAFMVASSDRSGIHPQCDERVAERAYELADAMLAERERSTP